MDTKIVVTALVIIVAVPILLGYGMNFQDVEKSEYRPESEQLINGILNNSEVWSYTPSNAYSLNGQNILLENGQMIYPFYYGASSTNPTSMQLGKDGVFAANDMVVMMSPEHFGQIIPIIDPDAPNSFFDLDLNYGTGSGTTVNLTRVVGAYWDNEVLTVISLDLYGQTVTTTYSNPSHYYASVDTWIEYWGGSDYIDPINGWTINQPGFAMANELVGWKSPVLSNYLFFTVDLGGMETYSSAYITPNITTDGGTTSIQGTNITYSLVAATGTETTSHLELMGTKVPYVIDPSDPTKLATSGNVWQVGISQTGITAYYVSSWPGTYGLATSYYSTTLPIGVSADPTTIEFSGLEISDNGDHRFRMDYATQRNNYFNVIRDVTYDPDSIIQDDTASYRLTIPYSEIIGTSITWGGVTFPVTNGSITVGGSNVSIDKLRLESIYEDGQRTNLINGVKISTGDNSVSFNGIWSSAIYQSKLTLHEWTENQWVAGGFAWNGVDESFALIGLLTCGAVFVGLGMYGRRSGAKVGTLMLICGGAALVFLALL